MDLPAVFWGSETGSKKHFRKGILINDIKEYSVPLKITGLRTFCECSWKWDSCHSLLVKRVCLLLCVWLALNEDKDNDNIKSVINSIDYGGETSSNKSSRKMLNPFIKRGSSISKVSLMASVGWQGLALKASLSLIKKCFPSSCC